MITFLNKKNRRPKQKKRGGGAVIDRFVNTLVNAGEKEGLDLAVAQTEGLSQFGERDVQQQINTNSQVSLQITSTEVSKSN